MPPERAPGWFEAKVETHDEQIKELFTSHRTFSRELSGLQRAIDNVLSQIAVVGSHIEMIGGHLETMPERMRTEVTAALGSIPVDVERLNKIRKYAFTALVILGIAGFLQICWGDTGLLKLALRLAHGGD